MSEQIQEASTAAGHQPMLPMLPRPAPSGMATLGGFAAAASPMQPLGGPFAHTMIIFDWDDTLLCSSALRSAQPSSELLKQLERAVEAILLTSMSLGETLIVTNGTESWIQDSAARFVPGLLPLLENITTISARARHEHRFPEDPLAWKREAFQELLHSLPAADATPDHPAARFGGRGLDSINLLIIGDSWYEIDAARSTFGSPGVPSILKTVKFKEVPTVQELLGQLRRSSQEMTRLVAGSCSTSLGLAAKPLPNHLECLVACASAWEITPEESSGSFTWAPAQSPPSLFLAASAPQQQQPQQPMLPPQLSQFTAPASLLHPPRLSSPARNLTLDYYLDPSAAARGPLPTAIDLGAPTPAMPPGHPLALGSRMQGLPSAPPLPQHGVGASYHLATVEQQKCGWVF